MTSPLVATNVALVRATVRVLRDQIGGFADRILRAAGLTAANVTAANGEQALRLLRSRPTELPKAVVAAAVVQAFAKLAAVSNVVLNIATLSERLDSQPLSFRALDLMNALTRMVRCGASRDSRRPSGCAVSERSATGCASVRSSRSSQA